MNVRRLFNEKRPDSHHQHDYFGIPFSGEVYARAGNRRWRHLLDDEGIDYELLGLSASEEIVRFSPRGWSPAPVPSR